MEGTECQRMWVRTKLKNLRSSGSMFNVFDVASGYNQRQYSIHLKQPLQLKLNLLLRTRHTGTQQFVTWLTCWFCFVHPYVSVFSPNVCHQKLVEIVHREEEKVNWILSAKVVFLNSGKGPRDRYKLPATQHFTRFQKGRQKNGAGTERTWYLIWKAADRCLLKVGHSECCCTGRLSLCCKPFQNTSISFQK